MAGHPLVVGFLLQSGAKISESSPDPLLLASRYGRIECAGILLETGSNVNCLDPAVCFDFMV